MPSRPLHPQAQTRTQQHRRAGRSRECSTRCQAAAMGSSLAAATHCTHDRPSRPTTTTTTAATDHATQGAAPRRSRSASPLGPGSRQRSTLQEHVRHGPRCRHFQSPANLESYLCRLRPRRLPRPRRPQGRSPPSPCTRIGSLFSWRRLRQPIVLRRLQTRALSQPTATASRPSRQRRETARMLAD